MKQSEKPQINNLMMQQKTLEQELTKLKPMERKKLKKSDQK